MKHNGKIKIRAEPRRLFFNANQSKEERLLNEKTNNTFGNGDGGEE